MKSPENRTEKVRRILEDAGCELHGLWYAFGTSDGFALVEAPDNVTAAADSLAITSSGEALERSRDIAYVAPAAGVHA